MHLLSPLVQTDMPESYPLQVQEFLHKEQE